MASAMLSERAWTVKLVVSGESSSWAALELIGRGGPAGVATPPPTG